MRIRSVPASADPQQEPPLRRAIRAGLLDACVRGETVGVLWTRSQPWQPLQVMISATRSALDTPDRPDHDIPLLFPLGARGDAVAEEELSKLLLSVNHWVPCGGLAEPVPETGALKAAARSSPGTLLPSTTWPATWPTRNSPGWSTASH
jgi:hypothetical protein